MKDRFGRPLKSLRISVTDRCNLRCLYCMPEEEYVWLRRDDLLSFEELSDTVDHFLSLGLERVRLTGGEPLLRRNLPHLVELLSSKPALREVALTTNGLHLARHARSLFEAGLSRVTVSLDTLSPDRFKRLARRHNLEDVLAGIAAVAHTPGLKFDTVVLADENDQELPQLLEFAAQVGAEARFIEYMDVGGATQWSPGRVVTASEMLARLEREFGAITPLPALDSAPARRYRLADGQTFGIISSVSEPFCASCDRARLTADGQLLLCLYATRGHDLRGWLRGGEDVSARLTQVWSARTDRGAEQRAALEKRGTFIPIEELRCDPHLEMHTRGG
ncbi:MAG: GTP 3',8-cyclase MoaA [Vulcanimicrobiota bacterium]